MGGVYNQNVGGNSSINAGKWSINANFEDNV